MFQAGPLFALRLTLPAALVSLLVMRRLFAMCVLDKPLSIAPDRLQTHLDWGGSLFGVAFAVTIAAWLAHRYLGLQYAVVAVVLLGLADVGSWTDAAQATRVAALQACCGPKCLPPQDHSGRSRDRCRAGHSVRSPLPSLDPADGAA